MKVSFWQTLSNVPRMDKDQWDASNIVLRLLVAARASLLVLTLSSAAFGILLALPDIQGFRAAAVLLALLLAHATNNLLNDNVDFRRGLDDDNYFRSQYGTHPLARGWLTDTQHRLYIAVTGVAALLTGIWICWQAGWTAVLSLLIGSFFLLFYTHPLKHLGLGEISVWLVWGPLMVGSSAAVVSGRLELQPYVMGGVFGLGPLLVILAKHTDKLADDTTRGVRTLPVRIGDDLARLCMRLTLLAQWLAVGTYIAVSQQWFYALLACSAPWAWAFARQLGSPRPDQAPDEGWQTVWPLWFSAGAFVYARLAGGLLLLAALLHQIALPGLFPNLSLVD